MPDFHCQRRADPLASAPPKAVDREPPPPCRDADDLASLAAARIEQLHQLLFAPGDWDFVGLRSHRERRPIRDNSPTGGPCPERLDSTGSLVGCPLGQLASREQVNDKRR